MQLFSVLLRVPWTVYMSGRKGSQKFLTFLHTSAASTRGHRSHHMSKPRTTTMLKSFCVGEKSFLELPIWPWGCSLCKSWPCAHCQCVELKASGWTWRQLVHEDRHTSNVPPHYWPRFLLHLYPCLISDCLKDSKIHEWWLSLRAPDVHSSW